MSARATRLLPDVVTRSFGDITIHVVNTGFVQVKAQHRRLRGPISLRMLSIVLDREWTEWMPVLVAIVVHPEGVFLVDAGMSEETLTTGTTACDAITARVYRHLLRFDFSPERRIDRQLHALDIAPERIAGIVLTHRHADHADALAHLPASAEVYVGQGDWPSHAGALPSRWPSARTPMLVGTAGEAMGGFPNTHALTHDGRVRVVPMPGHSPGHLGLMARTEGHDVVCAGDATFSHQDLFAQRLAGIVERPIEAAATLRTLRSHVEAHPTQVLLCHDSQALERFARGEMTQPDVA
jgi:glyoxylase-like metal-dependent hydrolase (beta-lactamase superfamily II)